MNKKIIIIGAGIAGLAAGIYARKNNYDTTIYEMHSLPGGMCTAWKRKGFTFEGCFHYIGLGGSGPAHAFYGLWKELGVFPAIKIIHNDVFNTFYDSRGRTLRIFSDPDKLKQNLLDLSPADEKEIKTLHRAVKRCIWLVKTTGKNPFLFIAKIVNIVRGIPLLKKYSHMNAGDYADRFKDPLIRRAMNTFFIYPDLPCIQIFLFLAMKYIKSLGYPQGSSLQFSKTLENKYYELKGKIGYKKKVKRIIMKKNRVTGIQFENGTEEAADIIISAADGHTTLFKMLEDKFTSQTLRKRYETESLYPPFIQVSLGVNRDMKGTPHSVMAETSHPFEVAGQTRDVLHYQHFAYDPSLAPEGKTPVTVLYPSHLCWWENIGYKTSEYKIEKEKIVNTTIVQLEKLLPGISQQIETSDVATPFTMIRYTNNWEASSGFMLTQKIIEDLVMKTQYTLPGLHNFYMIGQWVKGMSVVMAAQSGKEVIEKICKADRKRFKTK